MIANCVLTLAPGERFITRSAGGGAVGDPLRAPAEKVLRGRPRAGYVSRGARDDYGVVDRPAIGSRSTSTTTAAVRRARSAA